APRWLRTRPSLHSPRKFGPGRSRCCATRRIMKRIGTDPDSGAQASFPVLRGQRRLRSKVRTESIADELVEQEDPRGVFDFEAALEIEAAREELAFADRDFEEVRLLQEALRHVDAAND